MLDLKDLQCLTALARHRHFARAANECGVSQPAFSMRIRKIEERLGTPIVKRGNRFQGFTHEGEVVVRHARRITDDVKQLENEVRSARGEVSGALTLGVIPTAAGYASLLTIELGRKHPDIRVRCETATSLAVQQGIEEGRFDAGITYTEGASPDLMRVDALYDEGYALLIPDALAPRSAGEITWSEAAELPLCLLEPAMQNRRIIDQTFAQIGETPQVVAETSGFIQAIVMATEGHAASVVPTVLVGSFGGLSGTVALPLVDPVVEKSVCLVTPHRNPGLPAVEAMRNVALDFNKCELS